MLIVGLGCYVSGFLIFCVHMWAEARRHARGPVHPWLQAAADQSIGLALLGALLLMVAAGQADHWAFGALVAAIMSAPIFVADGLMRRQRRIRASATTGSPGDPSSPRT